MKTMLFIIFVVLTIPTTIIGVIWRIISIGFQSGEELVNSFIKWL